jgi:DNA-binding MarR family transcriptional regulator
MKDLTSVLDEDLKRLLAAILEFSSVMRRDEPGGVDKPDHGLGLTRAIWEHGLGQRHASALLSVALWGPMTVTELARRHHVEVKTASLVAVELEQAGLLGRQDDPADRRRTILTVARGKERIVAEGLKKRAGPLRRALDQLTAAQREGLITGLELIARQMPGHPRSNG